MNVLSLFDGMSCGQIALEKAGIKIDNYYASEIDTNAIKIAQKNYPNTIHVGDVSKLKGADFKNIDLIIGGSPCQNLSIAIPKSKALGLNGEKSKLFYHFARLIDEIKPKYFLLENVKMSKIWSDEISNILGVGVIKINSNQLSAQNRNRFYWTNIPIELITNKNISLNSILETSVDDKYYLDESKLEKIRYAKGSKAIPRTKNGFEYIYKEGEVKFPNDLLGKAQTLTTSCGGNNRGTTFIEDKHGIRKLSTIECERLQTVPDNYTNIISNSQRYKLLGNGWTVDVIAHILKGIRNVTLTE